MFFHSSIRFVSLLLNCSCELFLWVKISLSWKYTKYILTLCYVLLWCLIGILQFSGKDTSAWRIKGCACWTAYMHYGNLQNHNLKILTTSSIALTNRRWYWRTFWEKWSIILYILFRTLQDLQLLSHFITYCLNISLSPHWYLH